MPERTLLHEIAHVVLGHTAETLEQDGPRTPRSLREVEAEGVAYLCSAALELEDAEYSRGYLDGTTEAYVGLDVGEPSNGVPRQVLQRLDDEGWWRSFRYLGTVDGEGFAAFEEDPAIPRIKNTAPRTVEGTVCDDVGTPLASANVAVIDRRDGEILGQGLTDEVGHFHLTAVTAKDRVSHRYVVTRHGISCDLIDASVVTETEEAKTVELPLRP